MPKYNVRRKAQLGLDIREGGIAIPIAPNMYYMDGRSHDNGGIAIGPNNKNGLEVEGGEVVKVGKNDVKVFSSVPLLRGVSPAQLVMEGANPNKVFAAQEDFKDRNRINDDGTRYEVGGEKRIYIPSKSIQRQIQETGRITIGGAPTIGGLRTYGYLRGLTTAKKYGAKGSLIFRAGKELIKRGTQKLVDNGKITKEVAQIPRSIYGQFIGAYGQNLPKTIGLINNNMEQKKAGGIYIKPSKRGTFTAAATKHGMGVQEFASKVLNNKEDYSPAMVKKANFARNASRWKKEYGGLSSENSSNYEPNLKGVKVTPSSENIFNEDVYRASKGNFQDVLSDSANKAADFMSNWYTGRKSTGKFNDQLEFIENRASLPTIVRGIASGSGAANYTGSPISNFINVNPAVPKTNWGEEGKHRGDYVSRLIHEMAHGYSMYRKTPDSKAIENHEASPTLKKLQSYMGDSFRMFPLNSEDTENAGEYYARLMQMREAMGADPTRTDYTEKELNPWLNRFGLPTGEKGTWMMNNLVDANNSNLGISRKLNSNTFTNKPFKAAYGTSLDTRTKLLRRLEEKKNKRGNYNGGEFGGAGASSVIIKQPEFITDTITKRYLVPVTQNFNDAFGDAVNAGLDKFMFDNKWYNTKKGNNPNNNAVGAARTQTVYLPVEHKEVRRRKKEFGGSMIYTINGNVKNRLMSARPKAKYGLATKYLKKRNKTTENSVEIKQNDEPKILDIRNTANYKIKQVAENPLVKYPVDIASYLLTGATAKGMQTGAKVTNKVVNKIDDILGKPRQDYLSRNVSDKTISYTANSKTSIGSTYKATSKDLSRAKKEVQNRPTINDLAEAKSTVGNIPQHTSISYNPSSQNPVSTINYFDVKNTKLPNIERFGRKQMDAKTSRELDKVYRKAVGNKEPKSGFGRVPQQTTIEYTPKGESVTAYDASAEFHKRISDMLYNSLVKKYGKKGVDKAMKAEHISKYEYGGRIKAKDGKFLKYKNGVFTDPETNEQFDVDPEVFKMHGNTKEAGVIPTADYTKGTFNARPQYYAEKRLPIAGSQSIAEKAGLARSGWSYGENPTFDYVPNINISVPTNYSKAVGDNSKKSTSSTARGEGTKSSKATTKSIEYPSVVRRDEYYSSNEPKGNSTPIDESYAARQSRGIKAVNEQSPSSTGGKPQSKDGRWVGQYKTTNVGDWIGLGSNLAGTIASYFMTKNAINKMPEPIKPIMAQAAKLKTRYNVEPQLTEIREAEQMNRAAVRRNTQSSNTSLAREQRLMNEARGAKNTLYGQKENIETQLINQDRLNRQSVIRDNVRAYNEYLNKVTATKMAQNEMRVSNINNLISGLTGSVNSILDNIESRRATNNTLRAIAAANPNVDARLIGGFDYYIDPITKRKYNKNQQYVGTING